MKNIEINLYPYKTTTDKKVLKLIEKFFPIVFLGVLIAITLNILLFLIIGFSHLPYSKLNKQWQQLSPQVASVNSLKNELNSLREEKSRYQGLLSHKIEISHLFADIFKSLPKNIWLARITLKDNQMKLIGHVVEWKEDYSVSINKFIKQLQREPYCADVFDNIRVKSQKKQDFSGREVVRFEVECKSSN